MNIIVNITEECKGILLKHNMLDKAEGVKKEIEKHQSLSHFPIKHKQFHIRRMGNGRLVAV